MDGFTGGIIRHRRLVIALFLICTVVCAVLFLGVEVNYDLTDYLPEDAESTVALDLMLEEFGSGIPNTRVMACLLYTSVWRQGCCPRSPWRRPLSHR